MVKNVMISQITLKTGFLLVITISALKSEAIARTQKRICVIPMQLNLQLFYFLTNFTFCFLVSFRVCYRIWNQQIVLAINKSLTGIVRWGKSLG